MWEPTDEGMYPGSVAAEMFNPVLDEYYEWRGWDKDSGLQTRKSLEDVGLGDVADVLENEGSLA
jgi:aldehyde:ferredoxin oxidoreductase